MGNTVQNLVPYVLRATVPPGVTGIANGLMSNVSKKQLKVSFTYFTMAEMTSIKTVFSFESLLPYWKLNNLSN